MAPFCSFCSRLGGNAPKSEAATGLAHAIFIRFLPILGGYAPKKSLDSRPCNWVVMLRITYLGLISSLLFSEKALEKKINFLLFSSSH